MSSILNWHTKGTWPLLLICSLFLFFFATLSYGQDAAQKFPDYYPENFNAIGTIDRIAEDEIVIGDTLYGLSSNTTYHTPTMKDASKSQFPVGSRVGLKTNPKREVTSLWLIE